MSTKRFRGPDPGLLKPDERQELRSPFVKDSDRIIFSAQFRRLQDKTQVHLAPRADFVRTRLTHSLEVSSVGRSLGTAIGDMILRDSDSMSSPADIQAADFGSVVAAACLAHDIGNPPFGHAGEDAIKHWFQQHLQYDLRFEKLSDLAGFDGNAQGFRILTRLAGWREQGGLRLTCATLGAFLKYPQGSTLRQYETKKISNKFGIFCDDLDSFAVIAEELGLQLRAGGQYARHPLAFLVEAADDICYLIADLEDGVELKLIPYKEVEGLLMRIVPPEEQQGLSKISEPRDRIEYLRAKAIGVLIRQAEQVFRKDASNILSGARQRSLLDDAEAAKCLTAILQVAQSNLYEDVNKLQLELVAYEVITGLLDLFTEAVSAVSEADNRSESPPPKYKKLLQLLPGLPRKADCEDKYSWLLRITDFVSSLTDSAALNLYRRLRGITLTS